MQAGEIKVRNLQEWGENTGRKSQKGMYCYIFFLIPFLEIFLSWGKMNDIYKHLLCARHSTKCFHMLSDLLITILWQKKHIIAILQWEKLSLRENN